MDVRRTLVLAPLAILISCASEGLVDRSGAALGGSVAGDAAEGGSAEEAGTADSGEANDGGTDATIDASAVDGADADVNACGSDPDCVVFTTRNFVRADFGGAASADALCMKATGPTNPLARVRGRVFKAWLSDASGSAAMRLVHSPKPYVGSDGVPIASNWAGFAGGGGALAHLNPIDHDEEGQSLRADLIGGVWTATDGTGAGPTKPMLASAPSDCSSWTSQSGPFPGNPSGYVSVGSFIATDNTWTDGGGASGGGTCGINAHFYCVQQ